MLSRRARWFGAFVIFGIAFFALLFISLMYRIGSPPTKVSGPATPTTPTPKPPAHPCVAVRPAVRVTIIPSTYMTSGVIAFRVTTSKSSHVVQTITRIFDADGKLVVTLHGHGPTATYHLNLANKAIWGVTAKWDWSTFGLHRWSVTASADGHTYCGSKTITGHYLNGDPPARAVQ